MSVHRTYLDDISKIMALTTIPKENWNGAWRDLAQDATKWKKLTKKWLLKQRHEEKNKVWSKQAEITPGGKSFHRAEKQRRDQQRPRRRISRLMRPNELSVLIAARSS